MAVRKRSIKRKKKQRPSKAMVHLYSYKVPNIVIVGKKEIRKKIQSIEKNFNLTLIFAEPDEVVNTVNTKTIAIIVDEKKLDRKVKNFIENLLGNYKFLPIFYLARTVRSANFYTSLYEKGLQGVIDWPKEANFLHNLIIESLRPHPKAIGKSSADKKLSKIIKSHLVLNGSYKGINVKVIDGFVFLEGSVKSLLDKKIIETESSKILGVKKVIVKNIKIKVIKKTTDKELERKIKMYIANILGDKKRSITVKVKNKVVTILGATANSGDLLDIERFCMKQVGIQEVIRYAKKKPNVVSKNVKKAKLLEERIKHMFDGVKFISIKIYGEYAEVSGTVKLKDDRNLVQEYLLQVLPVKKVVNKLFYSKER